ncbi:hypothetical protein F4808DRAFT_475128 [Astrocystis sublimbata]|nr:hypothetical protein F4808DRAFT_475128 [Astrocystis sublimbata]
MFSRILRWLKSCLGVEHEDAGGQAQRTRHNGYSKRPPPPPFNNMDRDNYDPAGRALQSPLYDNFQINNIHNKSPRAPSGQSYYTIGQPVAGHSQPRRSRASEQGVYWSTSFMDRDELREVFNLIQAALEHVPYAICGLAGIIDHGLANRHCNRVSIICPQECQKNVNSWALTKGYQVDGDSIGIITSRRLIRRVRVKFIPSGFERLKIQQSNCSQARVLSMISLLDFVAAGWLDSKRRGHEHALATIASDIFFCLEHLAASRTIIDHRYLPTFLGEEFFTEFSSRYNMARPGMAQAGIDVSAILALHRETAELREHDALLQQYGRRGDAAPKRPKGQFEDLRSSVHTTRGKAPLTQAQLDARPLPPTPQLPRQVYQPAENHQVVRSPGKSRPRTRGENRTNAGRDPTARRPRPKPVEKPPGNWI